MDRKELEKEGRAIEKALDRWYARRKEYLRIKKLMDLEDFRLGRRREEMLLAQIDGVYESAREYERRHREMYGNVSFGSNYEEKPRFQNSIVSWVKENLNKYPNLLIDLNPYKYITTFQIGHHIKILIGNQRLFLIGLFKLRWNPFMLITENISKFCYKFFSIYYRFKLF